MNVYLSALEIGIEDIVFDELEGRAGKVVVKLNKEVTQRQEELEVGSESSPSSDRSVKFPVSPTPNPKAD